MTARNVRYIVGAAHRITGIRKIMATTQATEPPKKDVLNPANPANESLPNDSPPSTTSTRLKASEISSKAHTLQQENRMPAKPGDKVDEVQLQKWLELLTPTMWDKSMIYVNRLYPRINRKQGDPDAFKYIDVITKDAIEAAGGTIRNHILQTHGGGKYILYITDTSRKQNQCIFEAICTITFDEAEPKLNLDEVELHNKENSGYVTYLQNKGILDSQKRIIKNLGTNAGNTTSTGQAGSGDTIAAVGQLFNQFATTFKQLNPQQKDELGKSGLTDLFLEKLKQEDPGKQMTMLTTMLTAMQAMVPKVDTSNSLGMKDVIQMMNDSHNKQMEMFKMLLESQKTNAASGSDDSDLDKLIKWKTALPELFGRGRGNSGEDREKSTAEIVLDGVKEVGLPILGIISQVIQNRTGAVPIVPVNVEQARQAAGMGGQPQPQQPQQLSPANVISMPQNSNVPNNTNAPAATGDTGLVMLQAYLVNYGMMIINAFKSGQTGVDVGQYIKGLAPMIGEDVYEIIKAQGKDKLLAAMKSVPEFWQQTGVLYGESRVQQFVEDFIDFEEILAEDDKEEPQK